MNNHGIHTITFIFNLALTLHTARAKIFLCRLKTCSTSSKQKHLRRRWKLFFFLLLFFSFSSHKKFFFTLQQKLLITCNVITLGREEAKEENYPRKMGTKTINKKKSAKKTSGWKFVSSLLSCSCCASLSEGEEENYEKREKEKSKKIISSFFFFLEIIRKNGRKRNCNIDITTDLKEEIMRLGEEVSSTRKGRRSKMLRNCGV